MCNKINLATPYQELSNILDAEGQKAVYWFNKKVGGEEGEWKKKDDVWLEMVRDPKHRPRIFPPQLYNAQSGNKWIVFYVGAYCPNYGARWFPFCLCYYETEGSIGCYGIGDDDKIYIFTSHFFQRLTERTDIKERGIDLLTEFFRRTLWVCGYDNNGKLAVYKNGQGQRGFYSVCLDGLCIGVLRDKDKTWEIRTFVPWHMLLQSQKKKAKPLIRRYLEFHKKLDYPDPVDCEVEEVDEDVVEEIRAELVSMQINNHSIINVNLMEKQMINDLNKVIRDCGISNFSGIVLGATGMDKDKFLGLAEVEYVLSRLLPFCNVERDRERMMKACKQWLSLVVEHGYSKNLEPYISKYGKTAVIMAIEDLLEHNIWGGPNGKDALKNRGVGHYEDLEAIEEEVETLKEKGVISDDDLPKEDELIEPVEKETASEDESMFVSDEKATEAIEKGVTAMTQLNESFDTIHSYVRDHTNVEAIMKSFEKMKNQRTGLEKSLEQKNEKIKKLESDYQSAQDRYTKKSKECDDQCKQIATLKGSYNSMVDRVAELETELEETKKTSQVANTLPKKRVIPISKCLELPLTGPKAVKVWAAFLAKYDIVIDEKK